MKFYYNNIELEVPDSVYCPREDSLLLAKAVENIRLKSKKILDMGCGSGFLSILMAKDNNVTAADINEEAVKAAKENAARNNVKLRALQSDLFSDIHEIFDIIVFNPPYLPEPFSFAICKERSSLRSQRSKASLQKKNPREKESIQWDGGRSGRDAIEKFIRQAKSHLNKNGKILLLISSLTGEKEVIGLFEKNGFKAGIIAREKIPWEELMVIEAYIF